MMHAACMSMEGFVMLSSGDEIGQVNDYDYKKNPDTAADSRYLHRSPFQWDNADKRKKSGYSTVRHLEWSEADGRNTASGKFALEKLPVFLPGIQEIMRFLRLEERRK